MVIFKTITGGIAGGLLFPILWYLAMLAGGVWAHEFLPVWPRISVGLLILLGLFVSGSYATGAWTYTASRRGKEAGE